MALKKCKECGHDVSTKAKTCPHCGASVKTTSTITWLVLIIMILFEIGSLLPEQDTIKRKVDVQKKETITFDIQEKVIPQRKDIPQKVTVQKKKNYEAEIKAYAKKKWPDDYEMQVYEYDNQMKALNQIMRLSSNADYNKSILLKAMAKWGENYEMVIYEYNNQLESYKKMR